MTEETMTTKTSEGVPQEVREWMGGSMDGAYGVAGVEFTQCDSFTTFRAEYAYREDTVMLVVHFFVPESILGAEGSWDYWMKRFPSVLSDVAQEVLAQTYPDLQAGYVSEIQSWWLTSNRRAPIDLDGLVQGLFLAMDQTLAEHMPGGSDDHGNETGSTTSEAP